MAKMRPLDPAPKVPLPKDGWELLATEAGRFGTGLRATVQVWNGDMRAVRQLTLANSDSWTDFVGEISAQIGIETDPIVTALRALAPGVEGVLRQMEAHGEGRGASQATRLVDLAADAELFHSRDGDGFITIPVDGHRETWPLRTKAFRRWLARRFYVEHDQAPGSQALQDALNVLEGKALHEGPEYPVFTRLAEHEGTIYLDLANDRWEAIEITATGWRIVPDPPVKFRRTRGMLPLPYPLAGGILADLRPFTNVPAESEADWVLFEAWLHQALRPQGPYPALILHGEQGAAKSTQARLVRALIDPNAAPLRAEPREVRDVMIAATNAWVLAFDNLSHLPTWLSDVCCRLATGGGFSTRELYSDAEEMLFDAQRPLILNGIEELVTRADLLDRAVILYLPAIPEEQRRPEAEFWRAFDEKRPGILGALLDSVSLALRQVATVQLERLPRMADFAVWVTAGASALGFEPDVFLEAYSGNRAAANDLALEASLIVPPLRVLLDAGSWLGTASALLETLSQHVEESTRKQRGWPGDGRAMSNALRRLGSNLRAIGITVTFMKRASGRRLIFIEKHRQG
jgi:hypothetical protein